MKNMMKTYFTYIIYFLFPILLVLGAKFIFNYSYTSTNLKDVLYLNTICDCSFVLLFALINRDILKTRNKVEGIDKKEKIKNFFVNLLIVTALFFVVKIASAIVVSALLNIFNLSDGAKNQTYVEELFKMAPLLNIVTGAICAPIVEEIVFRGTVRRIIKDKRVFVTVSGLLFGLVHVLRYDLPIFVILILGCLIDAIVTSQLNKNKKVGLSILATIVMMLVMGLSLHVVSGDLISLIQTIPLSEVINSIMYIAMGVFLAIIYVKYDNIYLNIGCHALNNLISYIMLFSLL